MSRKTSVQEIHFGDEPKSLTTMNFGDILNWYSVVKDSSQAKKYLLAYLKKNNKKKEIKIVNTINDSSFPNTIGWISRMITNGIEIDSDNMKWFNDKLKQLLKDNKDNIETTVSRKSKVSVVDNMLKQLQFSVIGDLDHIVDERDTTFDVIGFLVENNIQPRTASFIPRFFESELNYVNSALANDKESKEYYNTSTKELKKLKAVLDHIINECARYVDASRPKTARKSKKIDKLKGLRYLPDSAEFGVKSVNPSKLLTAKIVYVFDTKTKRLYEIHSKDDDGIWVAGVTFQNVDEEKSTSKTIPNKDLKAVIQKINTSGKRASSNAYEKINRKPGGTLKRSSDTLIILNTF